jgi:carbonic anhydrase
MRLVVGRPEIGIGRTGMRRFWVLLLSLIWLLVIPAAALAESSAARVERVMTRQEQQALTPGQVFQLLKEGNRRFVSGDVTTRDHSSQVRAAVAGQFPKAMILSCIDSRIPVEDVFDQGIGDVFVARVAGNFENTDILGSMEYATKVSGAKLVLVMGHEDCGAIKAAIDRAKLGNITAMLENIQPAVAALSSYEGDQTSANPEFVHRVAVKNVQLTMERIRQRSPILRELEERGEIEIRGALYEMKSGKLEFFD